MRNIICTLNFVFCGANMTFLRIVAFISAVLLWPAQGKADEIHEYLKFSCIPEIGYAELTTTRSYGKVKKEQADIYGLWTGHDNPTCSFPQYDVKVEFELIQFNCQESPCLNSRWYTVNVKINGNTAHTFEEFGNQNVVPMAGFDAFKEAYAPHIMAYQYFNGFHYIHACTGFARRKCESLRFNPKQFTGEK